MTPPLIPFVNPATGEQFGAVASSSAADVTRARQEMARAAPVWRDTPLRQRVQILKKLQRVMLNHIDAITDVITRDTGKSRQDALIEVFLVVNRLHVYCRHAADWLRPEAVPAGLYFYKRYRAIPEPYGVVAVISPWNYPFDLTLPSLVAALLAGNTVLLKPSEVTPAVGELVERLIQSVPELSPYVRVLHGDASVGAAVVDSRPDLIFLTGSVATARHIARRAAEDLIPFVHELGGKDPMIVLEDADIAAAARWGCWGAFYHAGQTCMSIERVYVHEAVYDRFLAAVLAETEQIRTDYSTAIWSDHHYGPITFARQMEIIRDHLDDARAQGARILAGGQIDGAFVAPTVVVDVNHDMRLMRDETFGPIMPIMKVRDEAEAIRLANDSDYGLSASVWSRDRRRAERVARQLEVGSVIINDTIAHYAVAQLPFGGVKQSGNARTHGRSDVLQFTRQRAVATGGPPVATDLATRLRLPGNYYLGKAVLQLVFGVTPGQRWQGVHDMWTQFRHRPVAVQEAPAPPDPGLSTNGQRLTVTGAGVLLAVAGLIFGVLRWRRVG